MQFTLKTLLVLFVVLASSIAAFGPAGIVMTFVVAIGGLRFRKENNWGGQIGCLAVFFFVLASFLFFFLPGIQAGVEAERVREEGSCRKDLWRIGRALCDYHDDHGSFPPAYVADNQGKRMHGWRMLLLPYVYGKKTYEAYDFKQPWNGPNNRVLTATTDALYFCREGRSPDPTCTDYFAVVGPGTAWPGERGARLDEFKDGPERTILLVEWTGRNILWAEPRDVTIEEAIGSMEESTRVPQSHHRTTKASMFPYFLGKYPIAGHVLMADGSVIEIPRCLSRADLAAMLSIDGSEEGNVNEIVRRYEPSLLGSLRWDHVVGLPLFLAAVLWFWIRLEADAKFR